MPSAAVPTRVGINAVFLRPRMGGLETYVRALVPELVRLAPGTRFTVFAGSDGIEHLRREPWAGEVDLRSHPLLRPGLKAISEVSLLGALASRSVDLLHSVAMTAPWRTRAVNVVTLADVIWITEPEPGESATVRLWKVIVPPLARRADRVIAISEASARDLVSQLGVRRERIDVIPLAPGLTAPPAPTPEVELRERLGLGAGPIVLSVSAKKRHKNLLRLVAAMASVREREPGAVLVLPGNPTPHEQELRTQAARLGLAGNVAFPAWVSDADLEGLYAAARCLAMASTNEGFGLPLLEAMRRDLPIACSRASALPEVAGEAARYFDPLDTADIAAAIEELLGDPLLAARLVAAGRRRQADFTWARVAEQTLETYARAAAAAAAR